MFSDKKYQVFVSSTYEDLKEERAAVVNALLAAGHIPVGTDLTPASESSPWATITGLIDGCDYYVVVVAHRYGSLEKIGGTGYTEKEYRYAANRGTPILPFLIAPDAAWPEEKKQKQNVTKLRPFKQELEKKGVVHWENKEDLAAKVVAALTEAAQSAPRGGWVRANVLDELQTDYAALKKEYLATTPAKDADAGYNAADYKKELELFLPNFKKQTKAIQVIAAAGTTSVSTSLSELFFALYSGVREGLGVSAFDRADIRTVLANYYAENQKELGFKEIGPDAIDDIFSLLALTGLISNFSENQDSVLWQFTPKGRAAYEALKS